MDIIEQRKLYKMDKLFIEPVKGMEKVAYFKVSEDANEWNRQVLGFFHEQFPYFANIPVKLDWKRKDEEKGYAVGTIEIRDGEGMIVPVIIRAYNLYPFDVAYVQGNIMPLTSSTIQMYIQSKGAFLKVVPKEKADVTTFLFNMGTPEYLPSTYEGTGYNKRASLLDKIASTITEERKKEFLDYLENNPSVLEGFKQNDTMGPIMKIAAAVYKDVNYADKLRNRIERDIHYIYKTANYEYKGIFGNSRVDDPVELSLDENQASRFDKVKTAEKESLEKTSHVKYAAVYTVSNSDRQIAILEDRSYFEIPPERRKLAEVENKKINDEPAIQDSGLFKHGEFVSKPFRVTEIWTDEKDRTYIETFDGLHKTAYCRFKGIKQPYTENGITYLPNDAAFVKLADRIDLPSTYNLEKATNWVTKTAEDRYRVNGAALDYWPSNEREDIDIHKVNWMLIQSGAGQNDLDKVASLRIGEKYGINRNLNRPVPFSKLANWIDNEKTNRVKLIPELAKNMVKEAAQLGDVPTVDAILSLQFATKNNIEEFVEFLPLFEESVHYLARMLLVTRLGNELVREDTIKRTMLNMIDIIEVLQGLKTIVEKGK